MNSHSNFAPAAAPIVPDQTPSVTFATQPVVSPADAMNDPVHDGGIRRWWRSLRGSTARAVTWVRSLGPYVAIELILPGGTLIALALWTYRRRRAAQAEAKAAASTTPASPAGPSTLLRGLSPCTQR